MKILIVDDDLEVANALSDFLELSGHSSCVTGSAEEALIELRSNQRYDIVISDVKMPGKNGIELLVEIKKDKTLNRIPVILMTAHRIEKEILKNAFRNGVSDFFEKPFKNKEVLESISNIEKEKTEFSKSSLSIDLKYISNHKLRHVTAKLSSIIELVNNEFLSLTEAINILEDIRVEVTESAKKIEEISPREHNGKSSSSLFNNIWLIDDDEFTNTYNKYMFEKYTDSIVKTFHCPLYAFEKLIKDEEVPDIIYLDINMPTLSGFEFLEIMRNESRLNTVPVTMLSSSKQLKDIQRSFAYSNVVNYIVKPLRKEYFDTFSKKENITNRR